MLAGLHRFGAEGLLRAIGHTDRDLSLELRSFNDGNPDDTVPGVVRLEHRGSQAVTPAMAGAGVRIEEHA